MATNLSGLVDVLQRQNTILTAILAAINALVTGQTALTAATTALAPASMVATGPQVTQQITGNGQTIVVGMNGSSVITTTTGGNMTGIILAAVSLAGQRFTVINTTIYTITFTASVAGTPSQAAGTAQSYIWNGTGSVWEQVA